MEFSIEDLIEKFSNKINNYYSASIFSNEILRTFNGTNIDIKDFYKIYSESKYFKNETYNDKAINKKIINSLIDIILLNIILNEVDRLDNLGINMLNPKNEFETLYNISKDMNLINKTKILWERIMNFTYLIIERDDLEKKKSSNRSKGLAFKKWYDSKGYVFFDEYYSFINVFDQKYRTPETHKSSTLRKLFLNDESSPIFGISLKMAMSFGTNIYPNILLILSDSKYMKLDWQKVVSLDGKNVPPEFQKIPDWVEDYCHTNGLSVDETYSVSITKEL